MQYDYQIIKSIIVNFENRYKTHLQKDMYKSPDSWSKAIYRLCRQKLDKQERTRMPYDEFKLKKNTYFKVSEKAKWNRKISSLVASNMNFVNEYEELGIQWMILKLERRRMDTSNEYPKQKPLSRIIENFNRSNITIKENEWDIPIQHLVKKFNWINQKKI